MVKVLSSRATKRLRDTVLGFEAQTKVGVPAFSTQRSGEFNWVNVSNDSGVDLPGYSLVAFKAGTVANGEHFIRKVTKISTTFRPQLAAVEPGGIKAGKNGFVTTDPQVILKYDTAATPAIDEGWGCKPDSFLATKGFPGCLVLAVDTTRQLVLVSLESPITTLLGKTTADNAAGAMATDTSDYKIYKGTAGSEADAGFTTQPAIYLREAMSNNTFFTAHFANGSWYADAQTGGGMTMYKAKLNGALAETDASATIDNVTCFGGGTAPSPTSAANTLDLGGNDNDDCVIVKDGTGYYLLQVMHHDCEV